jgi:hypothetical protein
MLMSMEQSVELLAGVGETEVLGENLLLWPFVHYKSYMTWRELEHGPQRREARDLALDTARP